MRRIDLLYNEMDLLYHFSKKWDPHWEEQRYDWYTFLRNELQINNSVRFSIRNNIYNYIQERYLWNDHDTF